MMISLQLIWSDVLGFVDITLENVMGSSWSLAWIVLERFKSFRISLSSFPLLFVTETSCELEFTGEFKTTLGYLLFWKLILDQHCPLQALAVRLWCFWTVYVAFPPSPMWK